MVNTRRTQFSERVFPTNSYSSEEEEKPEKLGYKLSKERKNPKLPRQPKGPTLPKKCLTYDKSYDPSNPPIKEFTPSTRSAQNYLLFCEALNQISPKVVRKEPTTCKSMPPIDTDDGGVPIPYLETYIAYFIDSRRKESERVPTPENCQGCLLKDENNCRGMFKLTLPAFIRKYMEAEKELEWEIMKEIPFIWLVLWMESVEPNTKDDGWEKYVITRTCGNIKCTNGLHMKWAPPQRRKLPGVRYTNDPTNYYMGPQKPFPMGDVNTNK